MSRSLLPTLTAPLLALALSTGCIPDTGVPAPYTADISMTEEISLSWDSTFNERGDGTGALFILDILVFDAESGTPLDNIQVEVTSGWSGVYLIPKTAVKTVSYPGEPDPSACDADGDEIIDDDAPDSCSWYWDTTGQQYFQLAGDFADAYRPNYLIGATDNRGIMRTYLYVDDVPETDLAFGDVQIMASLGHTSTAMMITVDN